MNPWVLQAMTVAVAALGLRVLYAGWRGDPPAHVASGLITLILVVYSLFNDYPLIVAVFGLSAGWQFGCAYMLHVGRPRVVRLQFYRNQETGEWVQTEHPSQHGDGHWR